MTVARTKPQDTKMGDWIILACNLAFGVLEAIRRCMNQAPVATIETETLRRRLSEPDASLVLIDARSAAEQSISTLPGAITCAEYECNLDLWSNREVVVYCTVGGRSYLYARKLAGRGVPAKNYRAGIIGWCRAGLPLTTQAGTTTNAVHPYWKCFRVPSQYLIKR